MNSVKIIDNDATLLRQKLNNSQASFSPMKTRPFNHIVIIIE